MILSFITDLIDQVGEIMAKRSVKKQQQKTTLWCTFYDDWKGCKATILRIWLIIPLYS